MLALTHANVVAIHTGHIAPFLRLTRFRALLRLRLSDMAAGTFCFSIFFDAKQVTRPQLLEAAYPALVNLTDRHYVQGVDPLPAFFARVNQVGFPQHFHVFHDSEPRKVRESLYDLGSCPRS